MENMDMEIFCILYTALVRPDLELPMQTGAHI